MSERINPRKLFMELIELGLLVFVFLFFASTYSSKAKGAAASSFLGITDPISCIFIVLAVKLLLKMADFIWGFEYIFIFESIGNFFRRILVTNRRSRIVANFLRLNKSELSKLWDLLMKPFKAIVEFIKKSFKGKVNLKGFSKRTIEISAIGFEALIKFPVIVVNWVIELIPKGINNILGKWILKYIPGFKEIYASFEFLFNIIVDGILIILGIAGVIAPFIKIFGSNPIPFWVGILGLLLAATAIEHLMSKFKQLRGKKEGDEKKPVFPKSEEMDWFQKIIVFCMKLAIIWFVIFWPLSSAYSWQTGNAFIKFSKTIAILLVGWIAIEIFDVIKYGLDRFVRGREKGFKKKLLGSLSAMGSLYFKADDLERKYSKEYYERLKEYITFIESQEQQMQDYFFDVVKQISRKEEGIEKEQIIAAFVKVLRQKRKSNEDIQKISEAVEIWEDTEIVRRNEPNRP